MTSKLFDPHKSFLSLKILWIVIVLHCALAILISCAIFSNSHLTFDWSYQGFNQAVKIFSVPLSILALIIPVVALLAANHRSEQTKEQIRIAAEQNNFSNYYKHLDEFNKFTEKTFNPKESRIESASIFHSIAFKNAKNGDFSVSKDFIDSAEIMLDEFIDLGDSIGKKDPSSSLQALINMKSIFDNFCDSNSIVIVQRTLHTVRTEGGEISLPLGSLRSFITQIQVLCSVLDKVLKFDTKFQQSEKIQLIINSNLSSIPEFDERSVPLLIPNIPLKQLLASKN